MKKKIKIIDYRKDSTFSKARTISKILCVRSQVHSIDSILSEVKKYLPKPKGKCVIPTLYNFDIIIHPGKRSDLSTEDQLPGSFDNNLYFLGTYEAGTIDFIKNRLQTGHTFIDVGAHYGLMSFVASRVVGKEGRIVAVEPIRKTYKNLITNIKLNKFLNIKSLNIALGEKNGTVKIYTHKVNDMKSSISPRKTELNNYLTSQEVKLKTIDSIVDEMKINKVNMLKIDVEGYEMNVIKGATHTIHRDKPDLIIEYSPNSTKSKRLLNFLKRMKIYKIYRLSKGRHFISKLVPFKSLSLLPKYNKVDNLFCISK